MNRRPSLLLTFGLFTTALVGLGQFLTSDHSASAPEEGALSTLPQEIQDAEAAYEARQQAIERSLHLVRAETLHLEPEARREAVFEWMEINRDILEAQAASSESIDALYTRHGLDTSIDVEAHLAATAPRTPEEAASPEGRRWALHADLARLRAAHLDDPEAFREAMMEWHETNSAALEQLDRELRPPIPTEPSLRPQPSLDAFDPPPGATPAQRELFTLRQTLHQGLADIPRPIPDAEGNIPLEALEAWRDAAAAVTEPAQPELEALEAATSRESLLQLQQLLLSRENLAPPTEPSAPDSPAGPSSHR